MDELLAVVILVELAVSGVSSAHESVSDAGGVDG
jgi:hypothetical protein